MECSDIGWFQTFPRKDKNFRIFSDHFKWKSKKWLWQREIAKMWLCSFGSHFSALSSEMVEYFFILKLPFLGIKFFQKSNISREFWHVSKIWNVQILVDFKLFPEKTKIFGFFSDHFKGRSKKMTTTEENFENDFVVLTVIFGLFYLKWSN